MHSPMNPDRLEALLAAPEGEHLEFKEAKRRFDFDLLVRYCAALANEGGGHVVLGVTDRRPRRVVGSEAFAELERTKAGLVDRLHLRVDATEVSHPEGRVVVFAVPSRPVGMPIPVQGAYWMRAGDGLVPMTPDLLRRIFDEAGPDFSAQVCPGATQEDLDPRATSAFVTAWARSSGNGAVARRPITRALEDAELLADGGLTYAALILFGTRRALGRYLPQAEVVFEYRSTEASGPAQQRLDFREGFLLWFDQLWELAQRHNDVQHFQDGLFMRSVPTFHEAVVRESVLNAVSHRDYRLPGSVFVRQYPRRLEVVSPGGLPEGITVENILWRQSPRNRRLAEALQRCGLVERSGQGMDRMFEACILNAQARPSFGGTDPWQVAMTFRGAVEDPRFLRFLEQVGQERLAHFSTEHFLVLDHVHREERVPEHLRPALRDLVDQAVVEVAGRGRGTRYFFSRRLYSWLGQEAAYTRKRGLDRETCKALLLRHVQDRAGVGSPMEELMEVVPSLTRGQVKGMLQDLARAGLAHSRGRTRAARWFPGPE